MLLKYLCFFLQDMTNQSAKATRIINYMKANKLTSLLCRKCETMSKKSAIGYLSHYEVNRLY